MGRVTKDTFHSELIGGHVALDLVNTVSWRLDEGRCDNLRDFPALAEWCRRTGVIDDVLTRDMLVEASEHPRAAQRVLNDVRALRENLYELLSQILKGDGSADTVSVHGSLRIAFVSALTHSDLGGRPMRWQLTPRRLVDLPRLLALQSLDLLQGSEPRLIRRCDDDACGWVFLDRTRSHTRRWCSSGDCGNRDRARRYYARQRSEFSNGTESPHE
jgi:predicted RNA-binding Zn ribbon-like protein